MSTLMVKYIDMLLLCWLKPKSGQFVFKGETAEQQNPPRPQGERRDGESPPAAAAAKAMRGARETLACVASSVNLDVNPSKYGEARELRAELQNRHLDPATRIFYTRSLSLGRGRYTVGPMDWQDVKGANAPFPPALRTHLEQKDISRMPANINPARNLELTLKEDPGLEKLGEWLSKQYMERRNELAALDACAPSAQQLTPPECLKFVTYLMSIVFKDRISADISPQASDQLSVYALSTGKQAVVCRNTAQIFRGWTMALQNLQAKTQPGNSPLASMYVRCVSAETTQSAPGIPRGHAWNEVFVKQPDGSIGVLVLDPNWGSQLNADMRFNYTQERISFTMMELESNIKSLTDSTVQSIRDYIKRLDSGEIRLTRKAVESIQARLDALLFDNRVTPVQSQALVAANIALRTAVGRHAASEGNAYTRAQYDTLTQAMLNKAGVRFTLNLSFSTRVPSENASPLSKIQFFDLISRGLNSLLLIVIKLYKSPQNSSGYQDAMGTLTKYRLTPATLGQQIQNAFAFLKQPATTRQFAGNQGYDQLVTNTETVIRRYLS